MLFLELALIRWTAANIVHLGYFSNFVLLGSFLGVGVGFLRAGRTTRDPLYFPIVLALLVAGVLRFPVTVDRSGSDLIFFTSLHTTGPPPWVVLPLVFVGVAGVMAGPGELVGRCFAQLPRLDAYRLDLLGSLLGIAAFTGALAAARAVGGVGRGRRRPDHRAAVATSRRPRPRARRPRGRSWRLLTVESLRRRRQLVAVLQGRRPPSTGRTASRGHHGVGQRRPAPGRDGRRDQGAAASRSTRSRTSGWRARRPGTVLDRRRRHRHRRRARAVARRDAASTRSRSTRGCSRSARSGTRTSRTTTRACTCTSTTAARSSSAATTNVRPDHLRAARLADAGRRRELAAAGELPVHRRRRCRRCATTSHPAARSRCTTSTARTG